MNAQSRFIIAEPQGAQLRLFKSIKTYMYLTVAYAATALLLFQRFLAKPDIVTVPHFDVMIPELVGMSLIGILALSAVFRTTSWLEKSALTVTVVTCVFFILSSLPLGRRDLLRAAHLDAIFLSLVCLAALLVGCCTLIAARGGH